MNKNAIKKFAIEARKKIIASVSDRAGMLGITPEGCSEPVTKGTDFEVYKTIAGTEVTLSKTQCDQRRKLKEQVETRGFEAVVEEVAYTWFNRICAIRFMEVNDYLPTRVRVLSSEKEGKNEPDIVTQAPDVDLDFTDKEREYILDCKMNNKLDDLFKMLFIKQCNKLSEILPELFESTEDYTEMLLNISYTNKDDIIYMLVNQETGIPEADFNVSTIDEDGQPTGQVEIIGWLYQYYNTELKDDTFAQLKKNIKISKERIPAATQLFTPDWIVRYMVENSVGRLWIEHLRAVDSTVNEKEVAEKFGWKYYLPEAEQEADVDMKLAEIRTSYKDLKPDDITCIDPCMGSGHILVAMFDVLMDIYKSAGYSERDAAFEIVEHNIHGLDIDKRAYQLAYFAIMMKGRGYNRRFFKTSDGKNVCPAVYVIAESNTIKRNQLCYFGMTLSVEKRTKAEKQICKLLDLMIDARDYGSLLKVEAYDWELLDEYISDVQDIGQLSFETIDIDETKTKLMTLIRIAQLLGQKYWAVITNPPYMGNGGMNNKVSDFVKKEYPESKTDTYSCFIEKNIMMTCKNGYVSMITMESWMFLSSFDYIRNIIVNEKIVESMTHMPYLGKGGTSLGINFGSTMFTLRNAYVDNHIGKYNAVTYLDTDSNGVPITYPIDNDRNREQNQNNFKLIPSAPIGYWLSDISFDNFRRMNTLGDYLSPRIGLITGDNNRFLRLWHEVDYSKIGFAVKSIEESVDSGKKWFPYQKGGDFRKWYGNIDYVVDWENDGYLMKNDNSDRGRVRSHNYNGDYSFIECITWTSVTTGNFACRYSPEGFLFDAAGPICKVNKQEDLFVLLGFLSSVVAKYYLNIINPTINYHPGYIMAIPFDMDSIIDYYEEISTLVNENIEISKQEWDMYENSWDFTEHPLCKFKGECLEDAVEEWEKWNEEKRLIIKRNEERINEIFIDVYGLQNELSSECEDKYITLKECHREDVIKSLISYALGCVFGRYSRGLSGIAYAGGEYNNSAYGNRKPDEDNIIPITDEEYFEDDIVGLICEWIREVFGSVYFEDNLEFISIYLKEKGVNPKECIRNYFLNSFYKDHCSNYSVTGSGKRPIYWLFDSGKENGFKCLIYMHRYNADTIGKIRIDYLHKTQKAIEQGMRSAEYIRDNASSGGEKSSATKRISKYTKQLAEIKQYDEAMAHIANQRIELDLDDGVKVNYAKFQGVEVAQEGKKAIKVDLLAKI